MLERIEYTVVVLVPDNVKSVISARIIAEGVAEGLEGQSPATTLFAVEVQRHGGSKDMYHLKASKSWVHKDTTPQSVT